MRHDGSLLSQQWLICWCSNLRHLLPAEGEGDAEAEAEAGGETPRSLEMENARLRAEVATQYAHEAARSLLAGDASHMAASLQRSLQLGEPQVSSQPARFREAGPKFLQAKPKVTHSSSRSLGQPNVCFGAAGQPGR